MSLAHQIKSQVLNLIGYITRNSRWFTLRRFLTKKIFNRLVRQQKYELKATTSFGSVMHLAVPDSIQTSIFLTGVWEPSITAIISKSLAAGDIFIDIGANVGYYSLLASKVVGNTGKVYAFEASPSIYRRLQHNMAANQSKNVISLNVAISNKPGTLWIWSAPEGNLGHSTVVDTVAERDGHHREAEVTCDGVAAFVPLADLISARLIKIDIEGAERLAIEGLIPYLGQFSDRTEWLIELSPSFCPGGAQDTDWIFNTFISAGYSAYKIENGYHKPFSRGDTSHGSIELIRVTEPPQERLNDILFTKHLELNAADKNRVS